MKKKKVWKVEPMKIPCEYCGQMIPETVQVCPHCGAANRKVKRSAYGVPTTIEELRAYCQRHNLPLKDMRVFLGEDYRGAKAFGIYRDGRTGNFVVYKNKADGTRAVRYEGNDEAYAVNELYMKIKERVAEQKRHMAPKRQGGSVKGRRILRRSLTYQLGVIALTLVLMLIAWFSSGPSSGYYVYRAHTYYYDSSYWYEWDDYDEEWMPTQAAAELVDHADDYYQSRNWSVGYEAEDFTESSWYSEKEWTDDDWDTDYDWDDGDSWDSSYDDWDSDW